MKAIVLAGGMGTRLRPKIQNVPKCLAPIGDKPFLSYIIDNLIQQNINNIIITTCYLHHLIEKFIENTYLDVNIQLIVEPAILGTGGSIYSCIQKLQLKQPFLVLNGDTLFGIKYKNLFNLEKSCTADVVMGVKEVDNCHRYGKVNLNSDNKVTKFLPKGSSDKGLIHAGATIVTPYIFEKLPPKGRVFSFEDYLEQNVSKLDIFSLQSRGFFIDIGIPEDYEKAIKYIKIKKHEEMED